MGRKRLYHTKEEELIAHRAANNRWRNSIKGKATTKRYFESDIGKEARKRGNEAEYMRTRWLKHRYHLTLDEFDRILTKQKECCAICGKHQSKFKKRLAVDHNHETGKIRGLLCSRCNMGLGFFQDDRKLLWAAINYLRGS